MQRGKVVAVFYLLNHFVGDEHAFVEFFSAVYYTVSYCVNLVVAFYAADNRVGEVVEYGLYGSFVVGESEFGYFFAAVGALEFQETVGKTYFFNAAFSEGLVCVCVNKFVFYRAAAAV